MTILRFEAGNNPPVMDPIPYSSITPLGNMNDTQVIRMRQ